MKKVDAQLPDFDQLTKEYFAFSYQAYPVWATSLGIHTQDHRLGDFDRASIEAILDKERGFLARLLAIDPQGWPNDEAIDYALLLSRIKSNIRYWDRLRFWEKNPYEYVDTIVWGCYLLISRDFAPLEERLATLLGRLREAPRLLAAAKENLENPPPVYTDVGLVSSQASIPMFAEEIPALAQKMPSLASEVTEASQGVAAALQDYFEFLAGAILPRSQGEFAIGRAMYEEMLREDHFLDYDADSMLATGQRLHAQIKARMEELAHEIDPQKPLREVVADLGKKHPAPEMLLEVYRQEMQRAKEFALEKGLVTLPGEEELEVVETPPSFWSIIPYAMYMSPAPFEKQQKGIFFVTPVNPTATAEQKEQQLAGHSRYKVPVVALHEAIPGHHLQLLWANTSDSLVRKHSQSTLFVEGWAFYCEELMEKHGFITDPRSKLMRLAGELWRAARIIVDSSLHAQGMDFDRAVEIMVDAGLEPVNAKAEVRRYTMSPTQPMSYLIGKLEIQKLAAEYRRRKGSGFNLPEFHRDLLSCGSIPPALAARKLFGTD